LLQSKKSLTSVLLTLRHVLSGNDYFRHQYRTRSAIASKMEKFLNVIDVVVLISGLGENSRQEKPLSFFIFLYSPEIVKRARSEPKNP
jgi:hypothetical protein